MLKGIKPCANNVTKIKWGPDSGIIPIRSEGYPDNWQCKYCQFKEICDMVDGGEVRWDDFKGKLDGTQSA